MAKGQMLCADGKPVMFGETLYGGDGRNWLIVGIAERGRMTYTGCTSRTTGKKRRNHFSGMACP